MNSSLRIVLNTGLVFVIMFLIFVTTFTKVGVPLDKTIKNKQILIDYKGAIIWGSKSHVYFLHIILLEFKILIDYTNYVKYVSTIILQMQQLRCQSL